MEHSHRGKEYEKVHDEALALVRELCGVPDSHTVMFLQGGASMQFAMVPMNFLRAGEHAHYLVNGTWGEKAVEEARLLGDARVAATTEQGKTYVRVPDDADLKIEPPAAYAHYTSNETIHGVQFHHVPNVAGQTLICDMSSDFLARPVDVSAYSMIYAGAQKNVGPSGVVVVIARKDFIESGRKDIPKIFRYKTHADANSLYNTAPTFSIYLIRNVLSWMKEQGGVPAMEKLSQQKADLLYGVLDESPQVFRAPVEKGSRSRMNVVFRLASEELETKLVAEAKKLGMIGLKGHRSVGGIRVSLYNAVPLSDVAALASFLREFAAKNPA
jgi:phosphoserine aminotransferase